MGIKAVEKRADQSFPSVLCDLVKDGAEKMGKLPWHFLRGKNVDADANDEIGRGGEARFG